MRADQLAEILILCQQNPILAESQIHDNRIIRTGQKFCHREHIMPCSTERSNHREITAFVG